MHRPVETFRYRLFCDASRQVLSPYTSVKRPEFFCFITYFITPNTE